MVATTRLVAGSTRLSRPGSRSRPSTQHATHTPPAPTAIDSPIGPTGTIATTRLAFGSIRTTPIPGTAPQTAPAPTARPRTQRSARPVPATLAATRLAVGSTRKTVQPLAVHTAPGLAATASTGRSATLTLATTGDGIVVAGWSGRPTGRCIERVTGWAPWFPRPSRPTTTKAAISTRMPTALISRLRDGRIVSPPVRHSGSFHLSGSAEPPRCRGQAPGWTRAHSSPGGA